MKRQKYPPGWNARRVRKVIAHYENQSDQEQAAEIEAALKAENITMVAVPIPLSRKFYLSSGSASALRDLLRCQPRLGERSKASAPVPLFQRFELWPGFPLAAL